MNDGRILAENKKLKNKKKMTKNAKKGKKL